MPLDVTSREAMDRIDTMLREDHEFRAVPLTDRGKYRSWYALTLGALASVAGEDEVVFACTLHDSAADTADFIVFTSRLVTVAKVQAASSEEPAVAFRTVSRRSLRAMSISVDSRHDVEHAERIARTWPGIITFTLEYSTLEAPLTFSGPAAHPYRDSAPAPAAVLLAGLRTDLAGSPPA